LYSWLSNNHYRVLAIKTHQREIYNNGLYNLNKMLTNIYRGPNGMSVKKDSTLTKASTRRIARELRREHQYNYEAYLPLFEFIEDDVASAIVILHKRNLICFIHFTGTISDDVVKYSLRVLRNCYPVETLPDSFQVKNVPTRNDCCQDEFRVREYWFS